MNEVAEVLPVFVNFEDREKSEGDVEDFNFDSGGGFDESITFADGGSDGDGSHDLVKSANVSGGAGGSKPEGRAGEEEGELEEFDDAVLSWEDGAVRKPCRKKNGDGAGNDESGRNQSLFPGFRFGAQQVKFGEAGESGKERRRSIVNFQKGESSGGGAEGGFFSEGAWTRS